MCVEREDDSEIVIQLQIKAENENSFIIYMIPDPSIKHLIHG